jgi:hypothetical protein
VLEQVQPCTYENHRTAVVPTEQTNANRLAALTSFDVIHTMECQECPVNRCNDELASNVPNLPAKLPCYAPYLTA